MKNIECLSENFHVLVVNFSVYLNKLIFVMHNKSCRTTEDPSDRGCSNRSPTNKTKQNKKKKKKKKKTTLNTRQDRSQRVLLEAN